MASASRTITIRFDGSAAGLKRAASQVSKALEKTKDQAKKSGDSIGTGFSGSFMSAIKAGLKASVPNFLNEFGTTFNAGLKGMLSTPILGPIIIGAMAVLAASMALPLAAIISGALILGLGAGIVGFGVLIASQNAKVKKDFSKTFKEIKKIMADAVKPILPVLDTVQDVLKDVSKAFAPVIKQALKIAQGPLERFIKNLGKAFKEVADSGALESIMTAFSDILDAIGPQLPGLFKSIAKSVKQLGKTVAENSDVIGTIFAGLLTVIPPVLDTLGGLTRFFVFSFEVMLDSVNLVLGAVAGFLKILSHVPGFGWAKAAAAELDNMGDLFTAAKKRIEDNKIKAKLEASIVDFDAKLASARKQLKDPNLTKERKAQIRADIRQLLAAKANAQNALNSLHAPTVTIRVTPGNGKSNRNPGTVKGFRASGGPVGAGRTYLVGERGPELLTMAGRSGKITPNHKLANGEAGVGGNTINVNLSAYSDTFRLDQVMQDLYAMGVH